MPEMHDVQSLQQISVSPVGLGKPQFVVDITAICVGGERGTVGAS
jgi:hypothetical protein